VSPIRFDRCSGGWWAVPARIGKFGVTSRDRRRHTWEPAGSLGKAVGVFRDLGDRVDLSRRCARRRVGSSAAEPEEAAVTIPPSRRRTTAAGVLLVALALGASACGGGDADASDKPTKTASTSASASPTPTPTPAATPDPLSPFEDRPPVKALRSWADAAVRDVNARQHEFPTARQFQVDTDKVRHDVEFSWQQDFDKYFPGPLPFTPIAVSGSKGQARITTCVLGAGFSLKKQGGQPAEKRQVLPVVFTMAKQGGAWLLAGIVGGTADCSGVKIKEVQW
jgi:hypothetical protein